MPRKTKKPSKVTLLRREILILKTKLDAFERTVQRLAGERDTAIAERNEARRRTIPINPLDSGAGEVNFLPIGIQEINVDYETRDVVSHSGQRVVVQGSARAVIVARGDIVYIPPVKKP